MVVTILTFHTLSDLLKNNFSAIRLQQEINALFHEDNVGPNDAHGTQ